MVEKAFRIHGRELVKKLRELDRLDLDQIPMQWLSGWLQRMGQSGRGTRDELVNRLYRTIREYENK